jgi:hypothetical protein
VRLGQDQVGQHFNRTVLGRGEKLRAIHRMHHLRGVVDVLRRRLGQRKTPARETLKSARCRGQPKGLK